MPDEPREPIERPLRRDARPRTRWTPRRRVELIVGPFYRVATFRQKPTKRQALIALVALGALFFLVTASWSLAARVDPGHDPLWARGAGGPVGGVAVSPNGEVVAAAVSVGDGGRVLAYRASGAALANVSFAGPVTHLLLSPAGDRALVAVGPGPAPGLAVRGGPALYVLDIAAAAVIESRPLLENASTLAASGDLRVVAYTLREAREAVLLTNGTRAFEGRSRGAPSAAAVALGGEVAAFGADEGEVQVVNARRGEASALEFDGSAVTGLALSDDGRHLLVGLRSRNAEGGSLRLYDDAGATPRERWARPTERGVRAVALDGLGHVAVAVTGPKDPRLLVIDADEPLDDWSLGLASEPALALSGDGRTVALALGPGGVELYGTGGAQRWAYDALANGSRAESTAVALSWEGRVIAANAPGGDGLARVVRFDSQEEGGLLAPLWQKVALAGAIEFVVVLAAAAAVERRLARKREGHPPILPG